jgi:formamidopyrimidine-DNA glycosylase
MPELPEVETTRRGILPHLSRKTLTAIDVRQPKLRYPIDQPSLLSLVGESLIGINRRAKYLLLHFAHQTLIIHLGMSGSLRLVEPNSEWRKHDHWQLTFGEKALRYHDPRRFGFLLISESPQTHALISKLGVEPLSSEFNASYLFALCQRKRTPIKTLIMNQQIVVGIGNIYACEALFQAGIHPQQIANQLTITEIEKLSQAIVDQLTRAIRQGGSTLKDFINPDGNPGYFAQTLAVYGRAGKACPRCTTLIENIPIAGRSSFFCPKCQPLKLRESKGQQSTTRHLS